MENALKNWKEYCNKCRKEITGKVYYKYLTVNQGTEQQDEIDFSFCSKNCYSKG